MLHLFIFLTGSVFGMMLATVCLSKKNDPYKGDKEDKNGQQGNTGETGRVD